MHHSLEKTTRFTQSLAALRTEYVSLTCAACRGPRGYTAGTWLIALGHLAGLETSSAAAPDNANTGKISCASWPLHRCSIVCPAEGGSK